MRKLRISTGRSRLSARLAQKVVKWETLANRLLRYDVVDMTYDEYMALDRETQSKHKDVGYFVGGIFKGKQRLLHEMAARCVITLDIDHLDSWDIDAIESTYGSIEYVVHSTLKHCDDTPRLRLVFPLSKDIHPDQYEPVARGIAARIGLDLFDDTTFQPARIMFWPAVTKDGEIFKQWNKGFFLDPDAILDKYDDWQDFAEWPHSTRVKTLRPSTKRAEDPLTKQGIIGAFNRTFDIHAAIQRFELPYEPTEHDNRYRPVGATGPSGAVVYDDVFLYSHHESDVVGQQNVNAWDLVRLHRFSEQDEGCDTDHVPVMQRPSSKQMAALAGSIPEVQKELRTPADEMEDLKDEADDRTENKAGVGSSDADLTFQGLLDEINTISPEATNLLAVCQSMIPRIAAAKLDPQEIGILAATLNKTYPPPYPGKVALEKGITLAGKRLTAQVSTDGTIVDMERELIQAALSDHFAKGKHLKRIGRRCWTFEDGLWALVEDEPVRGKVAKTFTRLREERPEDMLQLVAAVGEGKTSGLVKSVWQMMCDELAMAADRADPLQLMRSFPLPVINCKNCELWFDKDGNMEKRKHRPDNFFTIRIDTEYDPTAKCPEWDRFMSMVFSNTCDVDDMVRHFEELGGYILQFSRWLKTWVMFHGEKDTGKSTAAMVMQEMLGNAYTGKPMAKLNDDRAQFTEAGLIGRLLMVDDDFAYDGHLPDGFLKTYSEEKPVTASIKYGADVNFRARCLPLILSNHWPITRDTTGAFLERALVIPFTHRIKGAARDDQRRAAMMLELPGILNRFIAGLIRLRKRGDWDRPMDCLEAEETWKVRSNPALQFIDECLHLGGGSDKRVKRSRLYDVYAQWNREQSGTGSGRQFVMKKGQFFERMRAKLGPEVKSGGEYWFIGVQVNLESVYEMDDLDDDWDT